MKSIKLRVLALFTVLCFVISTVLPIGVNNKAIAEDAGSYDQLAVQAVRNNYQEFKKGTPVNSGWGNLGPYDGYILTKAGVNLEAWIYDEKTYKEAVKDVIKDTFEKEKNNDEDKKVDAKQIAYQYLAAEVWGLEVEVDGETKDCTDLLEILKDRQKNSSNGSFDSNLYSNMPAFEVLGRAEAINQLVKIDEALEYIINSQDEATGAWTTSYKDFATTAQAIRSLYYLKAEAETEEEKEKINVSIKKGLKWIKDKQQENGSFINGEWDDPVVDTAEVIYTLKLLDKDDELINSDDWKIANELIEEYMLNEAMNEDGTFGSSGNIADNTYILDAYIMLGASLNDDTVLTLNVEPSSANIKIGETQQFSATVFDLKGDNNDVSNEVEWSVEDDYVASIDSGNNGKIIGLASGKTTVEATYQGIKATSALSVEYNKDLDRLAVQAVRTCYKSYQAGDFLSTYDAYSLTMAGVKLSKWEKNEKNLKESFLDKIADTIKEPNKKTEGKYAISAKEIAHEYLIAKAWGETDKAVALVDALVERQEEDGSFDNNIYSDMPAFAALGRGGDISKLNEKTVTSIVYDQAEDGSWGSFEPTAQAVRALDFLIKEEAVTEDEKDKVDKSIDAGLKWLEQQQQDDGSFTASSEWNGNIYWEDKLIDSTEVVRTIRAINENKTLEKLKEELQKWSKNGNSVIDYMENNSYNNGKFGDYGTLMDATCALDSYRILGAEIPDNVAISLKIAPDGIELNKGETQQYKATIYCTEDYEARDVTDKVEWTVTDGEIANVDKLSGLATAVAAGETEVKATYHDIDGTSVLIVKSNGGGGGDIEKGVKVKVIGKDNKILWGSDYVHLSKSKMNALDALKATGLSVKTHPDNKNFVISVEGKANEGSKGWMCKINGAEITDTADKAKVADGDSVVWWYSETAPEGGSGEEEIQEETEAESDDEILAEILKNKGEAVLDLAEQEDGIAQLSLDIVKELSNAEKTMIIKNKGVQLYFVPGALLTEQYEEALTDETARIEICAKEVSSGEKRRILEKAEIGESTGLFDIGGKVFDFTAQITRHIDEQEKKETSKETEKITGFNKLVKVSIDLSELKLSNEDILKLTAVRYEKDKYGNIKPVKLGGEFDFNTCVFTFYTDTFSLYSVVRAENLIEIKMGLNDACVSVSGDIIKLDTPAEVIEGHTMVPLRFIAESLGAQVQWLSEIRAAEIKAGDKTLQLGVDRISDKLKVSVVIRKGHILVPLRYVAEELDCYVKWFPDSKKIEIIK